MSDRDARRQLLRARIALERAELARDLASVRAAARPSSLWHAALGAAFGPAAGAQGGWIAGALGLLRRYPVVTSALGLAAPLLRRRRWLWRSALVASFAAGALAALWRGGRGVRPPAPPSPPSP